MADETKNELRMVAIEGGHLFMIATILAPYEGRMLSPDEVMVLIQKAAVKMGGFEAKIDPSRAN